MTDYRVRVCDVRAARLCTRGARSWFAAYGLDWSAFLADGIPASEIEALRDPFGDKAVKAALERGEAL